MDTRIRDVRFAVFGPDDGLIGIVISFRRSLLAVATMADFMCLARVSSGLGSS
jgi:hypothetical protein